MPNPVFVGLEFFVASRRNDFNYEREPVVTTLSDGRFVVSWREEFISEDWDWDSGEPNLPEINIMGRIFQSNGTPIGSQFLINTLTENHQVNPSISALPDGGFVVAWTDRSASVSDSAAGAVRGQVYFADGASSTPPRPAINPRRRSRPCQMAVSPSPGLTTARAAAILREPRSGARCSTRMAPRPGPNS